MRIHNVLLVTALFGNLSFGASTGDNSPDAGVNLALLPSAVLSGSVPAATGRGALSNILYNPTTGAYTVQTSWNEYGVAYDVNLGKISEADAFRWEVSWPTVKNINRITIGGTYPNQPQLFTKWKVQYRSGTVWTTLSEGQGGWISSGIYSWGGASQEPIVADAVRVIVFSDGTNDVVSIHLRGRGGQSSEEDDRWQSTKATLIQYLLSDTTTPPPPPPPRTGKVNIIFDTDIGPDCDDAGTLAILHAFANLGEATILGMAATVSSPWAAPCLDAINTYYGRPNIPVGTLKQSGFLTGSPYSETVAKNFPNDIESGDKAPDAISVYRQVLAAQPDNSVVMVATGPLTNMSNLLKSSSDSYSTLNGLDLIKKKVTKLVIMGGRFPSGSEWNIEQDAQAAQSVANSWPTEIIFSGEAIGNSIQTGYLLSSRTPVGNPVRKAYELYVGANNGRSSWDQTAMYYAVRGGDDGLFGLSSPGTVTFNGSNASFSASPTGRHRYMTKLKSDSEIASVIEELMIRTPGAVATSRSPEFYRRVTTANSRALTATPTRDLVDLSGRCANKTTFGGIAQMHRGFKGNRILIDRRSSSPILSIDK